MHSDMVYEGHNRLDKLLILDLFMKNTTDTNRGLSAKQLASTLQVCQCHKRGNSWEDCSLLNETRET